MIMTNFYLIIGFIYWVFCYAYGMTYIREGYVKNKIFGKICIVILMAFGCVVAVPFSIGSHLAGVFIRMEEE